MKKKNIGQDIIPKEKSIRNVKLPERRVEKEKEPISPIIEEKSSRIEPIVINRPPPPPTNPSYKYEYSEPKRPTKKWLYVTLLLLVLIIAFGISSLFKSAEIKISPRQQTVSLDQAFSAKKNISTNELGFQIVTTTKDVEKNVEATGEERVDKKASGTIIIYNNTSQAQKLVATTRFETPEGLIFRLITAVSVPSKSVKDGKTVAGSIEAEVSADKTGDSYNIGLKDFTIPGFKGDPKYSQIYGRSKTEMTGGFSGMQKVVSKEVIAAADKDLEASLKDSLAKDIVSQIPANFILYQNSLSYQLLPATTVNGPSSGSGAVLKKRGIAKAVIFDRASLTRSIVATSLPDEINTPLKISNLDALNFSIASSSQFNPDTSTSIYFKLKGEANFVWVLDENKLETDLLGLSKKSAKTVLSSYGAIKEAWVETRPFWNQTIPSDGSKVKLINTASI
jgi:hypothetical protein